MITKTLAFAAALSAASYSFAMQPAEGSYPQIQPTWSAAAPARAQVAGDAARYNLAGKPGQVRGEERPQFTPEYDNHPLTRAAVIADRDAYARMGILRIGNDG